LLCQKKEIDFPAITAYSVPVNWTKTNG